jgi:lactoylglutathione lyase
VSNLAASLRFYRAIGFIEIGHVDLDEQATLTMLKLPEDQVVALELVHRPIEGAVEIGTGFSHLVVQTNDLVATLESLSSAGLEPSPLQHPGGADGPKTAWLIDPDGYRIELVQWPAGQTDGLTAAFFEQVATQ